ncbi:Saccharopine dehydrogenase-domain-containing protein [Leucosporidium creatinivorum]|uniref:Saccharopine dehydrogenase-domain-containing protein n=1 Tax=Leucosporidium creatinivorum TaxID=106004 RepID=A0A1Y2FMZ7_9BASI|nr:Saccharopine dehydrogenase-domain-containing protein [Leucosporidium creatinivorum]
MAPRPYQIVVYGATGFTGQLVAQYLSTIEAVAGKWAVAGRNKAKVEERMNEVGVKAPVIVADASDHESLVQMCKQTKLVISLVGPYTTYGEPLVAAAAENGTHYVDLTGETPFVAHMVRKYARTAISTNALIIHACGYDSVPSDLTTFLAVQRLKGLIGESGKVGPVRSAFSFKGEVSGGTISSALTIMDGSADDKKIGMNPYALSPIAGSYKPLPTVVTSSTFAGKRTWGSFWIMGPYNSQIVRRSWGILETSDPSSKVLSYGSEFNYNEFMSMKGPISAFLASFSLLLSFAVLALFPPARWALRKWGPQPGTGPSKEMQETGWFKVVTTAKSVDGKHEAQMIMKGKGDPGYAATAKMITECALSIVLDYDRLPPLAKQGGPLTPATALGTVLVERLENTGHFSFSAGEGKKSEMAASSERAPLIGSAKPDMGSYTPAHPDLASLDVYSAIHRVFRDIRQWVDVPLSDEQMRSPEIQFAIIQPLEASFAEMNDPSIVYVLLLVRLQFLRERDSTLASSSLNETRAHLCELLAIKLLRHQATIEKGGNAGLLAMARALVGGLHAFQGAKEDVLERIRQSEGYASRVIAEGAGKTNALELAILGRARLFIKSQATQRVITAIWEGKIVYSSSSFINILPDRWKIQQINIYSVKDAPILDHYRLRVPKYRSMIDTGSFLVLFISFIAVIVDHHKRADNLPVDALSLHEKWFFFYGLGYSLDKLASVTEHGWSVYASGLTNGLDLMTVPIIALSFVFRIHSVWTNQEWASEQGFAILSCAACLLFPRLAFAAVSNNVLILSLRAMLADFFYLMAIAVFCFLGFVFALNHLCDGAYSISRISEWLIFIWFGLDGTGLEKSPKFHPYLGPGLITVYAALSNTLLVSLLVSILSTTYSQIAADAAAEDMFRKAVLTFEGVKSDSLFDYFPPLNLLALCIMWPISHVTSPRWFHKINVATCRLLSMPILLLIALYERQSSPNSPIRAWFSDLRVRMTQALPSRWTQKLSLLEGEPRLLCEAVFEYTPSGDEKEDSDEDDEPLSEDEVEDAIDPEAQRRNNCGRASRILAAPTRNISGAGTPVPPSLTTPSGATLPSGSPAPSLPPTRPTSPPTAAARPSKPTPISPSPSKQAVRFDSSPPSPSTLRPKPRSSHHQHPERLPSNASSGGYGTITRTRSPDRLNFDNSALSTSPHPPAPSAPARFESPLAKLYQFHEMDGSGSSVPNAGGVGGLKRRLSLGHQARAQTMSTAGTSGSWGAGGSAAGPGGEQMKELMNMVAELQNSLKRMEKRLEEKEGKEREGDRDD